MDKQVRCPSCEARFKESDLAEAFACPSCGSTQTPQYPDLDVTPTLNWDDCRLLANWASDYANHAYPDHPEFMDELNIVLAKLRKVQPKDAEGLTLEEEIADLERDSNWEHPTLSVGTNMPTPKEGYRN